jgi:integrase
MAYVKSKFPGIRYREHPIRKHGLKPDRYYFIRYKLNGKDKEEALGWASEGMTEAKAAARLAELKEARRTGQGEQTLAEKRAKAEAQRLSRQEAEAKEARDAVDLSQVWPKYYSVAQANKKPRTLMNEEQCFRLWIAPAIGSKPLRSIAPIHLEGIKKAMSDAGRSAQTIRHVLALIRQIINFARTNGLFSGDNVVSKVKMPKADAARLRFLTPGEADILLEALKFRSPNTHDLALLSLDAGARAGELFRLTWSDVDFAHGVLSFLDTKNGKTRQVPMTADARAMLEGRKAKALKTTHVFPTEASGEAIQVSETYNRVVAELGLNDGVTDRRHKVVFHTLRHSFASWLVQRGVPLITVGRLLGHSSLTMTERYSHLAPDYFKQAVDTLEAVRKAESVKVVSLRGSG